MLICEPILDQSNKQDGLYFLQLMKWGILQYCVVRPLWAFLSRPDFRTCSLTLRTTLAAVVLDYMGLYCEESWGFGWGHVYVRFLYSLLPDFSVELHDTC